MKHPSTKSAGITPTEQWLADLSERTFLSLWSWPNPFKDNGKEACDLIAYYDDCVIIFFDRHGGQLEKDGEISEVQWRRWRKKVVDAQMKTALGVRRYLTSGRSLYADEGSTKRLPLPVRLRNQDITLICVAHGATLAELREDGVVDGLRLEVRYLPFSDDDDFAITLDQNDPIHVLDTVSMPVTLRELSTVTDFVDYFRAKERFLRKGKSLVYSGEEDCIAHWIESHDGRNGRSFERGVGDFDGLQIEVGRWNRLVARPEFARRNKMMEDAWVWDYFIQKASHHVLNDTLRIKSGQPEGEGPLFVMAAETRFGRRILGKTIKSRIENFPEEMRVGGRLLSCLGSDNSRVMYVFLQAGHLRFGTLEQYREFRLNLLQIACMKVRVDYDLRGVQKVVGIATEPPKYYESVSEDFVLVEVDTLTDEMRHAAEHDAANAGVFKNGSLPVDIHTVHEFPDENDPTETMPLSI